MTVFITGIWNYKDLDRGSRLLVKGTCFETRKVNARWFYPMLAVILTFDWLASIVWYELVSNYKNLWACNTLLTYYFVTWIYELMHA